MPKLVHFFDKLEDRVRGWLSHRPIAYGLITGVGMVLFWRGVWHTADLISDVYIDPTGQYVPDGLRYFDGPVSLLIGVIILLMTGSFVSTFIGNEIIISGLRGEKKLAEKTESEVKTETGALARIEQEIEKVDARLEKIEKKIK